MQTGKADCDFASSHSKAKAIEQETPTPHSSHPPTDLQTLNMDDDEFEDWKICWHANLLFHRVVAEPQKCTVCSELYSFDKESRRSFFWLEGTKCSAGHWQAPNELQDGLSPGICATCDQNYMLDVVKGKYRCREEGCRRVVRVHESEVRGRLASDTELLEKFLSTVRKHRVFECAVHLEDFAYASDPSVAFTPPTPDCDHDRIVCDVGLKTSFENAIRGGRLQDLICLDPECKKPIPLAIIRQNVSVEVFKIYNKKLALKAISQDERFRWCVCGHGQIHAGGDSNPEWECLSCRKRHCYICREDTSGACPHLSAIDTKRMTRKMKQKESAQRIFSTAAQRAERMKKDAERRAQQENTAASLREIARTTKKCPSALCGNKIERNEGCGHFTCRKCKTEFCWACKVIWTHGVAKHLIGCRIGTRKTVAKASLSTVGYAVGWDEDPGYELSLDRGLWLLDGHR